MIEAMMHTANKMEEGGKPSLQSIGKIKVAELRKLLHAAGLDTKGKKLALVQRLHKHLVAMEPELEYEHATAGQCSIFISASSEPASACSPS